MRETEQTWNKKYFTNILETYTQTSKLNKYYRPILETKTIYVCKKKREKLRDDWMRQKIWNHDH